MIQNRLQQRAAGIVQGNRVGQTVRTFHCFSCGRHHVHRRNHGLCLVNRFQHVSGHGGGDPRVHINHIGIGHASLDGAFQNAARLGAHVFGKHNRHRAIAHFFHMLIRKPALNSSRLFQRQQFAVIADQGDGVVRNLLADGQVLRLAHDLRQRPDIHEAGLVETEGSLCLQQLEH